jgi:hypothetical protein
MSDYRGGFGLEIRFIGHFNTRLVITLNYSAIADFHTLQTTTVHVVFSVCCVLTSLTLVTASNYGNSSSAPTKSSLHKLPYNLRTTHSVTTLTNFQTRLGYDILERIEWKTPFIVVIQLCPWERVCLRRRYSVTTAYTCLLKICCLPAKCCFVVYFEVVTQ